MALISLEDLEGLDDEQLDNDITDNPEPIDGDDHLLSHWQAVASTHQVSVPAGEGAEPLFSIIHHKQQRITSHILSHTQSTEVGFVCCHVALGQSMSQVSREAK